MIKLCLPIDGVRSGLLGGSPVSRDYMKGVEARARMLAKATMVKGARWEKNVAPIDITAAKKEDADQP